jgi:hypothetical protein
MDDKEAAQAMVRGVYESGEAEINGRLYRYLKMTHMRRRRVFAFYSRVANHVQASDFSFLDSPEFEPVESIIMSSVMYNDSLLSKLGDAHWEKYESDYVTFIATSLAVISFPFFPESLTASASTSDPKAGTS